MHRGTRSSEKNGEAVQEKPREGTLGRGGKGGPPGRRETPPPFLSTLNSPNVFKRRVYESSPQSGLKCREHDSGVTHGRRKLHNNQ